MDIEGRKRIGFLPESPYLYQYLTGREFVTFCAELSHMTKDEIAPAVEETLKKVGMLHAGDARIVSYSK